MEVISTNDGSYFYLTENKNDNNLIKRQVLWKCRINQINIGRHYYLNFYLHDTVVINVFQDGPCFLAMKSHDNGLSSRTIFFLRPFPWDPECVSTYSSLSPKHINSERLGTSHQTANQTNKKSVKISRAHKKFCCGCGSARNISSTDLRWELAS